MNKQLYKTNEVKKRKLESSQDFLSLQEADKVSNYSGYSDNTDSS